MLKIYVYCSILLMALCAGCQTERDFFGNETENDRLVLNYSLENDISVKSSITPEEHENRIQSLFIFFFEYSTNQSGKLLNIYNVPLKSGSVYKETGSIPIDLTHEDYYNIEASGQYNLLITANSEYYTRANDYTGDKQNLDSLRIYFLDIWKEKTEEYIAQNAYLRLDNHKIDPERLPMSGKAIKTAGNPEINVVLNRSVSRLDIEVEDENYQLVSAAVYNVFSRTNVWDNSKATYQDDEYKNMETIPAEGENQIKGSLYVFENYVPSPQQNDKTTTCILVGLQRIKDDRGEKIAGETEYFRINMHPPKRMQHLKRNNTYRYKIRKVLGDGEVSESNAYEKGNHLLDGIINGWENEKFGDIVFDENNILAVSFASVYFSPEGGTATVDIFTHGPGELEINASHLPDNIFADLKNKKLVITAKKSNVEQEGSIAVKFANLQTTILIEQRSEKNEKLQLSHQTLEVFPPIIKEPYNSPEIKVTATGKWTAKLYNNPYQIVNGNDTVYQFSFDKENKRQEIKTTQTEGYATVYLHQNNETDNAIYSFVMFSLDDNPTISQVLLLTQRTSKIIVSSNDIVFDQEGKVSYPVETGENYYDIQVETGGEWIIEERQGKGFFECTPLNKNSLRIKATSNETSNTKKAVFRVYAKENKAFYQDITVIQDVHKLSLDPESGFGSISSDGGDTKVITVKGTGNWTAVIETNINNHSATLVPVNAETEQDEEESKNKITGVPGDKFKVRFPQLNTPFVEPVATVIITVDGTSVRKKIEIRQDALSPVGINLESWGNTNMGLDPVTHFDLLNQNIRNPTMFGVNGKVKIPHIEISVLNREPAHIKENTHIYQTGIGHRIKDYKPEYITTTHAEKIYKWLFKPKNEWANPDKPERHPDRIYFFMQTKDTPVSIKNLITKGVLPKTYEVELFDNPKDFLYYDIKFRNLENPMMRFLLKTGPFAIEETEARDENKYLIIGGISSYVKEWPDTFIPIIIDSQNRCFLGVDPTCQFVFMGDDELLDIAWNYYIGINTTILDERAYQRTQIINNLMAWMLYVGAYGENFLKEFR